MYDVVNFEIAGGTLVREVELGYDKVGKHCDKVSESTISARYIPRAGHMWTDKLIALTMVKDKAILLLKIAALLVETFIRPWWKQDSLFRFRHIL